VKKYREGNVEKKDLKRHEIVLKFILLAALEDFFRKLLCTFCIMDQQLNLYSKCKN